MTCSTDCVRLALTVSVAGLALVAATAARSATPLVRCGSSIGATQHGGGSGYRALFGNVAVPPAYLPQVVRSGPGQPRPWWRKAGFLIRPNGRRVAVAVMPGSRSIASITWGGAAPTSRLLFEGCPAGRLWSAYAGGFLLARRHACVALRVSEGRRSRIVRFGLDRRC